MTWITYLYFWSRKATWDDRLSYNDIDSIFNAFLKVGFARVQLPVRLEFEMAIDYFMIIRDLWKGKRLSSISNPLYVSIVTEITK